MLHDIEDNEKGKDHWQHRRIHISTLVSMIVRILLTLLSHSLLCTYTRLHQTLRYQHNLSDSMTVRVLQVRVKGKGGNAIGARTSVRSAASMCENFESWAGSCVRVGVVGTHVHCSCPQLTYQSLPNCNQYLGKSRRTMDGGDGQLSDAGELSSASYTKMSVEVC